MDNAYGKKSIITRILTPIVGGIKALPEPGASEWLVRNSGGVSFNCSFTVRDSGGTSYVCPRTVRDSAGTSYDPI